VFDGAAHGSASSSWALMAHAKTDSFEFASLSEQSSAVQHVTLARSQKPDRYGFAPGRRQKPANSDIIKGVCQEFWLRLGYAA
jgi:hypothetical protein